MQLELAECVPSALDDGDGGVAELAAMRPRKTPAVRPKAKPAATKRKLAFILPKALSDNGQTSKEPSVASSSVAPAAAQCPPIHRLVSQTNRRVIAATTNAKIACNPTNSNRFSKASTSRNRLAFILPKVTDSFQLVNSFEVIDGC